MQNKSKDSPEDLRGGTEQQDGTSSTTEQPGLIARGMQSLLHMGLGEMLLRAATNIFSVLAIAIVIWLAQMYFRQPAVNALSGGHTSAIPTIMPEAPSSTEALPFDLASEGISRQADLHTNVPERARQDIVKYTVQKGDTVSGIADRYGLQPKTIFAANYEILQDNPENLQPDQQLKDPSRRWRLLGVVGRHPLRAVGSLFQGQAAGHHLIPRQSSGSRLRRRPGKC